MDRYKFEGYISDYLENELSIQKRKEFERYLADNPTTQEQVDAVRKTIKSLNNLAKVPTSDAFMDKLQARIVQQKTIVPTEQPNRRPIIFGFTPLTATMMSLVVLAIVFVGYELLPTSPATQTAIPTQVTTNNVLPNPTNITPVTSVNTESTVAEADEDSLLNNVENPQDRPDFDDRINYVKTQ